jgi:flagellin
MGEMLQRMRELAVQSANATNSNDDRANLDAEFQQLAAETSRTIQNTRFNGFAVLASETPHTFHIGAGNADTDRITMNSTNMTTHASMTSVLNFAAAGAAPVNVLTQESSQNVLASIDGALTTINSERANFGAIQNRFEAVIANLQVTAENQTAARSRIMDADFAAETAALTRAQVLQQAGTAMLAQANQLPKNVLQLLQG